MHSDVRTLCAVLAVVLALPSCSSDEPSPAGQSPDAGSDAAPDSGEPSDGGPDADASVSQDGASDGGQDAEEAGVPGCGFGGSGPDAGVQVALVGSPSVLLEAEGVAQNLLEPAQQPLPWADRGHMRRGPCGEVGVLLLDTATAGPDGAPLLYADVTSGAGTPEVVVDSATGCAGCQSLFFDSLCRPLVLAAGDGDPYVQWVNSASGYWQESSAGLDLASLFPEASLVTSRYVGSDVGADGSMHVFLEAGPPEAHELVHGSRDLDHTSTWAFMRVGRVPSLGATQYRVDALGGIHALYVKTNPPCDPCDVSLYYGFEESGSWNEEIVQRGTWGPPLDELAPDASLAIDPTGEPWVAAWFQTRAVTGSLVSSELRFYGRVGGAWCGETLVSEADGFEGADGPRFTGASPQLTLDGEGRFHVVFSDYAQWHDSNGYANHSVGQVRHAVRAGETWTLTTLSSQDGPTVSPNPLRSMGVPTMVIGQQGTALHATALERVWETDSIYNSSPQPVTLRALVLRAELSAP